MPRVLLNFFPQIQNFYLELGRLQLQLNKPREALATYLFWGDNYPSRSLRNKDLIVKYL